MDRFINADLNTPPPALDMVHDPSLVCKGVSMEALQGAYALYRLSAHSMQRDAEVSDYLLLLKQHSSPLPVLDKRIKSIFQAAAQKAVHGK